MDMRILPPVNKCCCCIPLKVAQCFIAFIALATSGFGVTVVVFLSLFEDEFADYVGRVPEDAKWPLVAAVGFLSAVLAICGLMFLIAPLLKSGQASMLTVGFVIVMFMCTIILLITIVPTLVCVFSWFYLLDTKHCKLDLLPMDITLLVGLIVFVFVSAWCYYAVAIGNYVNILSTT